MKEAAALRRSHPAKGIRTAAIVVLAGAWPWVPAAAQGPHAPEPVGTLPARTIAPGQSASFDLAPYFRDADGDALAYAATVSDAAVATVSLSASVLTIAGVAPGTAVVATFASDPGGLSATQRTEVTIEELNRAPEPVGTIPGQSLAPGQWISISVSSYFSDPEGEVLSLSATTSDEAVAAVEVSGDVVTITQMGAGTAIVNVVARDPADLSAEHGIPVASGAVQSTRDPALPRNEQPELPQVRREQVGPPATEEADPPMPDTARARQLDTLPPPASGQEITVAVGVSRGELSMSGPGVIRPSTSAVFGPALDVYATLPVVGALGAQLGLGYVSRGGAFRFNDGGVSVDASVSFGDMIATAMARFEPISMFYVAAGPHMSFNADCSADVTIVGPHFRHSKWGDCSSDLVDIEFAEFDYGLTGTAGLELDVGSFRGVVNAVYHHGLGNIDESPYTARHRAMVFQVGVVRR